MILQTTLLEYYHSLIITQGLHTVNNRHFNIYLQDGSG